MPICLLRQIPNFSVLCWLLITPVAGAADRDPELQVLLPGVQMSVVAEHPALVTPTGIDVDDQGRIWLVATHTHFRPEDYDGPEHDEILVFADSTGDGKADQRSVFYNATTATMDLELGPAGWVYLAQRSSILRVRDSTGDGHGDQVQPIMHLETTADCRWRRLWLSTCLRLRSSSSLRGLEWRTARHSAHDSPVRRSAVCSAADGARFAGAIMERN